jgi:hypothetical protein
MPQFRDFIFSLPLDPDAEPRWDISQKKFNVLKSIQELFAMMQANNIRATSTEMLTNAFGWQNNEQDQQHDILEMSRILFEALEQSLSGTQYDSVIEELFFGKLNNVVICGVCGKERFNQ